MVTRDEIYNVIEAEEKPKRIFSITEEGGKYVLVRDPKMEQVERKLRSTRIPTVLQETHLITSRQLEEDEMMELVPNILYEVEFPSKFGGPGEVGSVIKLNMEKLHELGLLDEFLEVRRELLHKDKLPLLFKISHEEDNGHEKKRGTTFQTSLTRNPMSNPGSIHLSNLQRRQDEWNGKSINERLMKLVSKATKMMIPNIRGGGRQERWHAVASMTPYWKDNQEVTSIQLNYTPHNKSVDDSIRKFAASHTDSGDDPTGYSGLCMMGHFDDDHFAGRFNLTPLGLTTVIGKCEMLLFPAKLWMHCSSGSGTYDVPSNDPRRLSPSPLDHLTRLSKRTPFMRLNVVVFPNKRCLNPTWRQVHHELYSEKGRDIFPSARAHQEWMMRLWIANESEIMYWVEKMLAAEDYPEYGRAGETYQDKGPDLLMRTTKYLMKTNKAQSKEWYGKIKIKMKQSNDEAKRNAQAAGLRHEDPKEKATRLSKEYAANGKLRNKYIAKQRDVPPVDRLSPKEYCRLFAWIDSDTEELEFPSEECARKTLEFSSKENKEFKKLITKTQYLNCGTRVLNVKGGSVIPKVTWTNSDFHRKFNPVKDTIPANPTWRPLASQPEALKKWRMARLGKPTAQKRVYDKTFSEEKEQEDADKDTASQDDEDKENSEPVSCVTNVVPAKKRLSSAAYKGSSRLGKERDAGDGGSLASSGNAISVKRKGKILRSFGSELSQ